MVCINSMAHVSGFQSRLRSLEYIYGRNYITVAVVL